MSALSERYEENVARFDAVLRVKDNFDIIQKKLCVGHDELTLYFIDGFIKDGVMQKLMMHILSRESLGNDPEAFMRSSLPYVETEVVREEEGLVRMLLSGAAILFGSGFGACGIVIDARTYPARDTQEPEDDRVMTGARDGFVETLIFNTALIRRRVRDPALTMQYTSVGSVSQTDVVLCYMKDRADPGYVRHLEKKLASIKAEALNLGHESLVECLIGRHWCNPLPKIRTTERPDTAVAALLEGSVLILCDNAPQVLVLPTTIFDFLQETNDFYFPPLTGTYLRAVRHLVFWMTLFVIPSWYLFVRNPSWVPEWLLFILPTETGRLPILAQLLLVEFIVDGLRLASMNTPDMLSNSLSVVGGLILGDFAVGIGWLIPEVILYMAFVTIANFTQRNYELGYAFKFFRVLLLILTALFNWIGFLLGSLLILVMTALTRTVNGRRNYLYPLIPFNGKALLSIFVRLSKKRSDRMNGERVKMRSGRTGSNMK